MNYYLNVLKKYAVFEGRARRKEYWMFVLWNTIVTVALDIVFSFAGAHAATFVEWAYNVATLIPGFAVGTRRLHDTNRSGWWYFIGLIPLIGIIVLIVFFCTEGAAGDNKYGSNPKGAGNNAAVKQ